MTEKTLNQARYAYAKADTVFSNFLLGLRPNGSASPFPPATEALYYASRDSHFINEKWIAKRFTPILAEWPGKEAEIKAAFQLLVDAAAVVVSARAEMIAIRAAKAARTSNKAAVPLKHLPTTRERGGVTFKQDKRGTAHVATLNGVVIGKRHSVSRVYTHAVVHSGSKKVLSWASSLELAYKAAGSSRNGNCFVI